MLESKQPASSAGTAEPCPLADDMIRGADAIAEWMGLNRRQIYHLAATSRLPVFKMGSILCARKSRLMDWIKEQEERSIGGAA
jgi:hypothetical protein